MPPSLRWSLAAALLCAASLSAQTTASLSGVVRTVDGLAFRGVTVTIHSPALQQPRVTTTNDAGAYAFDVLPPGEYEVRFTAEGFATVTEHAIVRLAQVARVDEAMRPGFEAGIVVSAPPPPVIDTPAVSTNLTLKQIEQLPILRNQLATAQFAPGVTGNTLTNGTLSIDGGPGYDNLVLINGVVVTENTHGQMRPMYVEDAIEETTILSGAISAEYGRFTGGVVSTITKSGGNQTSGSLRDSLSSPKWTAVSPAGETRDSTLNNVWETTLGGAAIRDRLWFFGAGRWAKNDTARQTLSIPSFANPASPAGPAISYNEGNDQKRWEGKLTGQITPQHNLALSYFGISTKGTNVRFNPNFYDLNSLTTRNDPERLLALHYGGVATPNVLVEGHYSSRKFADRTGAFATDIVGGTVLLDRSNNNTRFNSPTLCGVCDVEKRNNEDAVLKAHAFLDAGAAGTHDLVGGIDRFTESRYANNHQSGSDFSLFVSRVQYLNGVVYPVVTPTTSSGGGSFIRWNPILVAPREDDLRTDSAFVNDVVSFGTHWQLSLGARYDRNHDVDADGVVSANDSKLSPRLSLQYDIRGDGRHRVNASFGHYVSHIADSIAASNQAAGNAASVDFAYRGPAINGSALTTPLDQVIRMVFDYFNNTQGGTSNLAANNLRANGTRTIPGYSTYFDGTLVSPYVREMTLGYGEQIGGHGYVRGDLIRRDWRDFYAASVTTQTEHVTTPLGIPVDLTLLRNSNNVHRNYNALLLQARWTPPRIDAGINYTYSKLRGNDDGETATSGASANIDPSLYYPEFFSYSRVSPSGWLPGDQRHRLRAWAGYDFPLRFGTFSASLLHSFDSGLPYSIAGPINLTKYAGAPATTGYASVPNGLYYFSDRGALRTEDLNSTDLALRLTVRAVHLEWFAQADVLNLFNNLAIVDPTRLGTTVNTAANSSALLPFNPKTQTPIECPQGAAASVCTAMGANYQLASNFGQPLNNLAYQTPRTFRISLGLRF